MRIAITQEHETVGVHCDGHRSVYATFSTVSAASWAVVLLDEYRGFRAAVDRLRELEDEDYMGCLPNGEF